MGTVSLQVVTGGQYGSEAKGAVTAAICNDLVQQEQGVTVVRIGGPNAGHSAVDRQGRLWALRQVPCGMVVDPSVQGVIADGSEIDWDVLLDEVTRLDDAGHNIRSRLVVSREATMVTANHKETETIDGLTSRIGSTGKGIGAARADRIMRRAPRVWDWVDKFQRAGITTAYGPDLVEDLNWLTRDNHTTVVLEGTQGYGLGLHAGYYPQCTSSDCRAVDFLSMAGISPWNTRRVQVHVVVRPYPIRVAGNSGPLHGETTWDELGLKPELTTVTKKVRRVGAWDETIVRAALAANGPGAKLACSMLDQIPEYVEDGNLTQAGADWLKGLEAEFETEVGWYGVGPTLDDWRQF